MIFCTAACLKNAAPGRKCHRDETVPQQQKDHLPWHNK